MRFIVGLLAVASALTGAAQAADKPEFGPAPSWVKPISVPLDNAKPDEAAVHVLLSDQQVAFEPGKRTLYEAVALKIQTPQGLAAGNISFPWRPETDVLTVHKLFIQRGDKTIDVLASGQTFTVLRREQNLDSATLDGVLTATIQPEGLQVGDVLELAASVASTDPVMKTHVEQTAGSWNTVPIARAHFRAQWPETAPVRVRATASLPPLKAVKAKGYSIVDLSLDDLQPVALPKDAPPRYRLGRLIEATDFASWAELGALLSPLYDQASVLPESGPLHAELERIRTLSPDPKARTEAALALVQDRIRYVALEMGAGGEAPANAETTWARRYGDCKGKTAVLLALLRALDIPAEPVLVSTVFGDGLDQRLPMVALFNHVVVRAVVAGKPYWLDGTRSGDLNLDRLITPAFGWGLPLAPAGATLIRIMPEPLTTPTESVSIHMDARAGLAIPAPTHIEAVMRGDEAITANLAFVNLVGDARKRAMREFWRLQYDFIDMTSTTATLDAKTGELRLSMDGLAHMEWKDGWYETDGTDVGYKADFVREAGPGNDAPFAVPYPYYRATKETIQLPAGFTVGASDIPADVNQTVAGLEYHRHATFSGDEFTVERSERSIAPEFPAKDAPAAQAVLRDLADKRVYLHKQEGYRATDQELTAALATTPTTEAGFVDRGNMLLERNRFDDAIKDLTQAHALDPKDEWALANRGLAYVWKGDYAAAEKDLAAADAIDPRNAVAYRARGLMAQRQDHFREAIAAYTTALDIDAGNMFALEERATLRMAVGDDQLALADAAAVLKRTPSRLDMMRLRANIFRRLGNQDAALAEAAAFVGANPTSEAYVTAARIYTGLHRDAEANRSYEQALAIKPQAYIYLDRARGRPMSDVAGRRADIDAALTLKPDWVAAIIDKAGLLSETGDHAGAIATTTAALAKAPGDLWLLVARGVAYAKAGDPARAEKDFAAARSKAVEPEQLNDICWTKATAGVMLDSALADCDAALIKAPDAAQILDSRAFVLLRLGRLDDAIGTYDRALAKYPRLAPSLFGRSIAWSRKGDKAKSDADASAALKIDPDVEDRFERYGIKL